MADTSHAAGSSALPAADTGVAVFTQCMVLDFPPTPVTTPTFFLDTTRITQGTIRGGRIDASTDIPGGGDGTAAWA